MRRQTVRGFLLVVFTFAAGIQTPDARAETPAEVRAIIEGRVGGLAKLRVPAKDEDLPQPADPQFRITPEKKRLGKLLYFDPIRNNNVQPEFGGVRALAQTASCGSCHSGFTASKSGQVINVAQGGAGFGFIDPATGRFVARRAALPGLIDLAPTLLEVKDQAGNVSISGRFDAIDSVPRVVPSMIGFAFNQRLLWDGAAGEPYDVTHPNKTNGNPLNLPAGESLAFLAFRAHRMADTQRFALQKFPAFMELFKRAFPEQADPFNISQNPDDLCNDDMVRRAVATFLRTVVTRNTPWDKFIAGDDAALTEQQLHGAALFFTPATQAGANCVACHSGPMFNKVLGDEAGTLGDENFHNLGVPEHPLQDLARAALQDPLHHDNGRGAVTDNKADDFKFKTPTLRQMRDAAPFTHGGAFATLRDIVSYINAGVPMADYAIAAGNIPTLFTNPRGPNLTGLGLSDADLDALIDFIENGLYDPDFTRYNEKSTTETFDLNVKDMTYDRTLKALGAVDGEAVSLLPQPNNDAQSIADFAAIRGTNKPATCGLLSIFNLFAGIAPLAWMRGRSRRMRR